MWAWFLVSLASQPGTSSSTTVSVAPCPSKRVTRSSLPRPRLPWIPRRSLTLRSWILTAHSTSTLSSATVSGPADVLALAERAAGDLRAAGRVTGELRFSPADYAEVTVEAEVAPAAS